MYDIVYVLKETDVNEELRYSLRSLANFPHRKVWFYGGCPVGLQPDYHVKVLQDKPTKWENINKMLKLVVDNDKITSNFWLFNDDFYIMEKVDKPVNYYDGSLYKRIVTLEDKFNGMTEYSKQLRKICQELISMGCDTRNFCVHIPMLVNRKKAKELFNIVDSPMFRSLYGNYHNIKAEQLPDCKISNLELKWKGSQYLSTNDNSFKGNVGEQIKRYFPDKCKYEK